MKNNWKMVKLGDLTHLSRGHNPPKSKFSPVAKEGYVRFYQIRDGWADDYAVYVPDSPQLHKVNPEDILMVAYRHIGKAFKGVTGAFNVALCKITNARKDLLDDEYLFQIIPTGYVKGELMKRAERSLIPSMSIDHLREIEIPLPPLAEQKRIITILNEAFAAIAQAKENAEKNLQNARELFDSYLQSIFANPGNGWEICNLEDYIKLIDYRGRTPVKTESGVRLITAKNVKLGYLQLEPQEFIAADNYDSWMTRGIPNFGDVIFTTEAPLANVAQIDTTEKLAFAQRIIVMQPLPNKLNQTFLKYMLVSNPIRNKIIGKGTGATVQGIKSSLLKKIEIYFPKSLSEQESIVNKLDSLSAETKKLENIYRQKINDLDELKKSILQKALSGELTAKRQVSNVIDFPVRIPNISATDLQAGIVALAFQRHQEKGKVLTLGHVKAEKIVHLAQSVLNIELEREPVKDAAGPNDFPRLKKVESRAEKAGFFRTIKGNYGYTYIPGSQFDNLIEKTKTALNDKAAELTDLIDLLVPMDTQQAELVATVYAAWNNLLIDNQTITDEAIVYEARENWHKDKLNIPRERFFKTISWMKQNNLIPNGKGKKVLARPKKS